MLREGVGVYRHPLTGGGRNGAQGASARSSWQLCPRVAVGWKEWRRLFCFHRTELLLLLA